MTTKKTTAKSTTDKKTTAKKSTSAKKSSPKKAAAPVTTVAAAPVEAAAPAVTEKLVATIVPEHPETAVSKEAAQAKPATVAAEAKGIVLTIGMFQKRLTDLGYYNGMWDGNYGRMTKLAVAKFQAKHGLTVNGDANAETLAAMGLSLTATY